MYLRSNSTIVNSTVVETPTKLRKDFVKFHKETFEHENITIDDFVWELDGRS
jgi:hypothetical protein